MIEDVKHLNLPPTAQAKHCNVQIYTLLVHELMFHDHHLKDTCE